MTRIEAVILTWKLAEVKTRLREIKIVNITHHEVFHSCEDMEVALSRTEIQLTVPEDRVEDAVTTIAKAAKTAKVGDGEIISYPIDRAIKIHDGRKFDEVSVELSIATAATMAATAVIEANQHRQGMGVR